MRKVYRLLLSYSFFCLALLTINNQAYAATRIWDGGGADNNASTVANWDGDATAPVAGDDLVFTGSTRTTPNLNSTINYNSITVSAPNFTITTAASVALSGGIYLNYDTIISPGSSRTLSAATGVTYGGTLTKGGAGILTIPAASSGAGGLKLIAGTLNINHDDALGTGAFQIGDTSGTTAVTFNVNAIRSLNNPISIYQNFTFSGTAALTLNGEVALYKTPTATISGQGMTITSVISDGSATYGINKLGAAVLTLSGANTFKGPVSIAAGTISVASINSVTGGASSSNLGAPTSTSDGTISIGAGSTAAILLYTGNGETTDRVINLAGTTGGASINQSGASGHLKFTSNLTATGAGAKTLTILGSTAATGELAGTIVDSTSTTAVTKSGTGTWTLSGNSTHSGLNTLSSGSKLLLAQNDALGTGTFTINGGILESTKPNLVITNNTLLNNSATISGTENIEFAGTFTQTGGSRVLTNSLGADNELRISGNVNLSGTATSYTLNVAGTGKTIITGNISNGATSTAGAITLNNASAQLTLAGTNTYDGTTTLTTGTLSLLGDHTGASGNITLTGGLLIVGDDLAVSTGTISLNGGSLKANTELTLPNTITVAASSTITGGSSINLTGVITATGSRSLTNTLDEGRALTITNQLNLAHSSTNYTFTFLGSGDTVISGTVDNGPTATACLLVVNGVGAKLTLSGNSLYDGRTTLTEGEIYFTGDRTGSIGPITLTAGTMYIKDTTAFGANTFNLNGGAITTIDADLNLPNAISFASDPTVTIFGGHNIELSGVLTSNGVTLINNLDQGSQLTITNSVIVSTGSLNYRLTIRGTNDTIISAVISDAGKSGVVLNAPGRTLTLSGANTFGGSIYLHAGTLLVANNSPNSEPGVFGDSADTVELGLAGSNEDVAIIITGPYDIGKTIRVLTSDVTDTGTRTVTLGGNSADNSQFSGIIYFGNNSQAGKSVNLTAAAGGQVTFSGVIRDPFFMDATDYLISKKGAGTVVLGATNLYTAKLAIDEGTLSVAADVNLGTAPGSPTADKISFNGGTLNISTGFTMNTNRGMTVNSAGGTIQVADSQTFTTGASFAGEGKLTKTGTGTLNLASSGNFEIGSLQINEGVMNDNGNNITVSATGSNVWSNTGTFNTSGTTIFSGSTPQIGSSNFHNLTINHNATFTANSIISGLLQIASDDAQLLFNAGSVYSVENIDINGSSDNLITMASSGGSGTSYQFNVNQSNPTVSYVDVQGADSSLGNKIDATDHSVNSGDNLNWEFVPTMLGIDIIDNLGNSIANPSVALDPIPLSLTYQVTNGVFGDSFQKIRVNTTDNASWSLSLAASDPTDLWSSSAPYDFNDATSSAQDGLDTDGVGGQLSVNPLVGTLDGTCNTGLSKGSAASFVEGITDSIILLTAAAGDTNCYVDFTGVDLQQSIPREQPVADDYNIDMVLTITAF